MITLTINKSGSNGDCHKVKYRIYTSMTDVNKNDDIALKQFLSAIEWESDDDFENPIVRIYDIFDKDDKPIDESHIKADMDITIFIINKQFEAINYPHQPIYFTSVLDLYSMIPDNTGAIEKYKAALAYECMQFELAGFFNIKAMIHSLRFISFVYANESAQKIYSRLINPML